MTETTTSDAVIAKISDEELDRLVAARETAKLAEREATTRELSPRKPDDHQPKNGQMIEFDFRGETYSVDARHSRDIRTGLLFQNGKPDGAIIRMIGEEGFEKLLTSMEDEDGFTEGEELASWVEAFFEKAGAKN